MNIRKIEKRKYERKMFFSKFYISIKNSSS